jgi:hypothetical protein
MQGRLWCVPSDGSSFDSCQFRPGPSGFIHHAPAAKSRCGAFLQDNEATHAMCCKSISNSYQHNTVTEALRIVTSRAGISSIRESMYSELDPSEDNSAGQDRGAFMHL